MATTETDIANLALSEIGSKLINSIDSDGSSEARICRLHFAPVRDGLLRNHGWNFATRRASLSLLAEVPLSDWQAAWQMPLDCVRHLRVSTGDAMISGQDFSIEGRKLLTRGCQAVSIVYVSNAAPVAEWDSLFVEAMTVLLASRVAGPLTQSPQLAGDLLARFQRLALPSARTVDAREVSAAEGGYRKLLKNSPLRQSRFRY